MRYRLLRVVAVLAITLGAVAVPSGATPVQARSECTGWSSTLVPPTSIRVFRTHLGRTQTVPFRAYVETVMASEWGGAPQAALRVGAVAVKQYAWYYAMHWRGGRDGGGRCFDVVDSSTDQVYNPARTPTSGQRAAVAATWNVVLFKGSRFFLTGYRAGPRSCAARADGWKLYQRSAVDCVHRYGDTPERLARRFYSNLSWVTPGVGDMTGDGRADVALATVDPVTGATTVRVATVDAAYRAAVAAGSLGAATVTTVAAGDLLGRATGDVNGDRRSDLVQLVRTATGISLQVMLSTARGFAPAATWWTSAVDPATAGDVSYRLVVADFDGDGRADAGIVRIVAGDAPSTALLVASSTGRSFAAVRRAWSAAADLSASELRAGDVTGDGRADLVVLSPAAAGGTAIRVAASPTRWSAAGLGTLRTWATEPLGLDAIHALVGDVNRDGRDDVVVVRRIGADGTRVVVYRATPTAGSFSRVAFSGTLPLSFAGTRWTIGDTTGDGRADLAAITDRGVDVNGLPLGIDGWRLFSTGSTFVARPWFTWTWATWATTVAY